MRYAVSVRYDEPLKQKTNFILKDLEKQDLKDISIKNRGVESFGKLSIVVAEIDDIKKKVNEHNKSEVEIAILESSAFERYPYTVTTAEILWNPLEYANRYESACALSAFVDMRYKQQGVEYEGPEKTEFADFEQIIGNVTRKYASDIVFILTILEELKEMNKLRDMSTSNMTEILQAGLWYVPSVAIIEKFKIQNEAVGNWLLANLHELIRVYANAHPEQIFVGMPTEEYSKEMFEKAGYKGYVADELIRGIYDTYEGITEEEAEEKARVYYKECRDFEPEEDTPPERPKLRLVK